MICYSSECAATTWLTPDNKSCISTVTHTVESPIITKQMSTYMQFEESDSYLSDFHQSTVWVFKLIQYFKYWNIKQPTCTTLGVCSGDVSAALVGLLIFTAMPDSSKLLPAPNLICLRKRLPGRSTISVGYSSLKQSTHLILHDDKSR